MTTRITTVGNEVAAKSPPTVSVSRQALEVVFDDAGTGGLSRITTVGIEVTAKSLAKIDVTRQALEVIFDDAGTGGLSRVTTVGVEVTAKAPVAVGVSRQALEVVFDDFGIGGLSRVTTIGIEVAAQAGVPEPIPLPLAAGLDWFMHNWADSVEMETTYNTDVNRSRDTNAEERSGLGERPARVITMRWLQQDREALDRLIVTLRRFTEENIQLPLYQDASLVTQDSFSGSSDLFVDASTRRFFGGARILVTPLAGQWFKSSEAFVFTVQSPLSDRIVIEGTLPQNFPQGRYAVAPLIDCELILEPQVRFRTIRVADLQLTVREFKGRSSLPPVALGFPQGWQIELGKPVFELDPDHTPGGPITGYRRYGRVQRQGRKQLPIPQGPRYVQTQEFDLALLRPDFWRVLSFFDSRKGRLNSFWAIDREFIWTVTDTDPTFIDVEPIGQFSDFNRDWTDQNTGAGIVMDSGLIFIRQINTVQDLGSSWRLTLAAGPTLPAINVSNIQRFARARLSRFDQDQLVEDWASINVMTGSLTVIETMNEGPVVI